MAEKQVITPWEVKGALDYDRLIHEFGLKHMPELPKQFNHLLFRRNIVFAHRDFERIVDAVEKKKPFVMMTGLMPSGKFHFGHKLVADQMVFYQGLGAKLYIAVADIEAYNTRIPNMAELHKTAVEEYLLNYVALGLEPKNCDFYFQSKRSKDGKKSNAYYSLANMLSRSATFNEFKAVYGEISPGKMSASLLQAADMLHPQLPEFEGKPLPVVVPVGPDQDPHLRLARDISQRTEVFKFMQLSSTYHLFQPGLKGGKMSSSDPMSFIALTDSPDEAEKKIKKFAFSGGQPTVEEHRKLGGNPDVDVAFQMLRYGLEPDDKKLAKIYDDYKSGKLLTSELKEIAIEKVKAFLSHHQKAREKARSKLDKFLWQD
jgi:tryptophanyl-tRNA synthetase